MIGEGEAQAARIANEAQAADPAFYQFLKTLETYRAALDAKTTLVLSADSSFLRLLTQGVPDPAGPKPSNSGSSSGEPVAAVAPTESGTALPTGNGAHGHDARGSTNAQEGQKP